MVATNWELAEERERTSPRGRVRSASPEGRVAPKVPKNAGSPHSIAEKKGKIAEWYTNNAPGAWQRGSDRTRLCAPSRAKRWADDNIRPPDTWTGVARDPAPYPGVMPDARPRPPREKPPPEIPEPAHFDPYDLVRMDQKPLGFHDSHHAHDESNVHRKKDNVKHHQVVTTKEEKEWLESGNIYAGRDTAENGEIQRLKYKNAVRRHGHEEFVNQPKPTPAPWQADFPYRPDKNPDIEPVEATVTGAWARVFSPNDPRSQSPRQARALLGQRLAAEARSRAAAEAAEASEDRPVTQRHARSYDVFKDLPHNKGVFINSRLDDFSRMDRHTLSPPTESLLRMHDVAMASPAIFERTHLREDRTARAMTESAGLTGEAKVDSKKGDIGGCYYGTAVEGNPRDPFYFSETDKAVLAFVRSQTPVRMRHPDPEGSRDQWLRVDQVQAEKWTRTSPDEEPRPVSAGRSLSPFPKQTAEEKRQIQEARASAEAQKKMARERVEAQMKFEEEVFAEQQRRDGSPLADYQPKHEKAGWIRPRFELSDPERKFTKDRTNTRPKPRGHWVLKQQGKQWRWKWYKLGRGPDDNADGDPHGDARTTGGESAWSASKAGSTKGSSARSSSKTEPLKLSEELALNRQRDRDRHQLEAQAPEFSLVQMHRAAHGSPFKPRRLPQDDGEEKEEKNSIDFLRAREKAPRVCRRSADDPASGDVPTPLAEAQEYCAMRQRQTPKITKFSFSMGKQYVSPFQDKEPMRIFLEKCRSRCPSMTTFEESRKTVGEIQTIDDTLDC